MPVVETVTRNGGPETQVILTSASASALDPTKIKPINMASLASMPSGGIVHVQLTPGNSGGVIVPDSVVVGSANNNSNNNNNSIVGGGAVVVAASANSSLTSAGLASSQQQPPQVITQSVIQSNQQHHQQQQQQHHQHPSLQHHPVVQTHLIGPASSAHPQHQASVIQQTSSAVAAAAAAAAAAADQTPVSLSSKVFILNKPNGSVIQSPSGGLSVTTPASGDIHHQLLSAKQINDQQAAAQAATATLLLCGTNPTSVAALASAAANASGSPGSPSTGVGQVEDEEQKRRRLARRPSYRKILNDISSTDGVSGVECTDTDEDSVDNSIANSHHQQPATITRLVSGAGGVSGTVPTTTIQLPSSYLKVLQPGSTIQLTSAAAAAAAAAAASSGAANSGNTTITGTPSSVVVTSQHDAAAIMNSAAAAAAAAAAQGSTIVQYAGQDGQFTLPGYRDLKTPTMPMQDSFGQSYQNSGSVSVSSGNGTGEDARKKREMRLLKNREAAKECRRKKKEYIKCLENRVSVLENQNKTLIEELETLKELYCKKAV